MANPRSRSQLAKALPDGAQVPAARTGRPRIKLTDLPHGWHEGMLEVYEQGASDTVVRAQVLAGMGERTWYRLIGREPEFAEAVQAGRRLCQVWWEGIGRDAADRSMQTFNGPVWIFNMKNRFGWRDVRERHTEVVAKTEVRTIVELVGAVDH